MNRDDIIRMAKEAEAWSLVDHDGIAALERFANLVAAAEREAFDAKYPIQLTHDQYNVVINAALKDEREACAKVCMDKWMEWMDASPDKRLDMRNDAEDCAFAIRERGAP